LLKVKLVSLLLVVCLFFLSLVACGGKSTIDFEDTLWYLDSYGEQGALKSVLEHTFISATFDSSDGRVHGNAGCNGYTADYELKDGITFSAVARTELGCTEPPGIMDQEDEYLRILESADTISIVDGKLHLSSGNEVLIFVKSTGRKPQR
jgi:heat shock protein HslJ